MASTINAGTTTATALNVTTDTTGALNIQTSGVTAIAIDAGQNVTLANELPTASGGTGLGSFTSGGALYATSTSALTTGTLPVASGGTGVTTSTGSGNNVLSVSPTFTGTPVAPTATAGTNTTQIATTAFVITNGVPSGCILLWSGSIATIPAGFYLCDGANSTPDLRDRFIVGAGSSYAVAATGGSADAVVVSHTHTASVTDPGHTHVLSVTPGGLGGQDPSTRALAGAGITASATTGISVTNASSGVSGTGANLPPYYALAYIMKA